MTITPTGTETFTLTKTPTRTPTETPTVTATFPTVGPVITAFGVARADGIIAPPNGIGAGGNYFWRREVPSGFLVYVEMAVSAGGFPIDTSTSKEDPEELPGLQVVSTHQWGDGSLTVCDAGPVPEFLAGGVPAVPGADFESNPAAVNDLGCRFSTRTLSGTGPCTRRGSGDAVFDNPLSSIQFCLLIGSEIAFPEGNNVHITARGRDILGRPGPPATIILVIPDP